MAATGCSACHRAPRTVGGVRPENVSTAGRASAQTSSSAVVASDSAEPTTGVRPHPARNDCATCHKPGPAFVFTHPAADSECSSCHSPTGAKHPHQTDCPTCHAAPGRTWAFSHPSPGATCSACHARPAGHTSAVGNLGCSSCHQAAGRSWAFSHPGVNAGCVSCHATTAPANHFGTSCATCHSPARGWANAVFHHPSIPGGRHTYKTFACIKCHPGTGHGPGHFCSCHGNTTGG